jgi:hypothetical protein
MNQIENSNRLIVRKEGGLFVLRSFRAGQQLETVKAYSAQMTLDYVRGTWPVGTKVQWIIVPRTPDSAKRRNGKTVTPRFAHSPIRRFNFAHLRDLLALSQ